MTVLKTYKYKLYSSKKNKHLSEMIDIASDVWNLSVAMYRDYYRLTGKSLSKYALQKYITKLKKRKNYMHWNALGSQAIQDAVERVDKSYKAFFDHLAKKRSGRKSPPHFCKRADYKSFTLKQAGYAFHDGNRVTIAKRNFKYSKSRPFEGTIKTVTVKRNHAGEFFLYVVTASEAADIIPRTGNSVGIDFGMKHYLNLDDGSIMDSPEWYKTSLKEVRAAHRAVSRCQMGSNNRKRAKAHLDRVHEKLGNSRRDWFFKTARYLCSKYAIICVEDLNLDGMKRLWGRKVSDLAYAEFLNILEWEATKFGTSVVKIDRWAPSSQACHVCGCKNDTLTLADREWVCPSCGTRLDRDVNAAINIRTLGLAKLENKKPA